MYQSNGLTDNFKANMAIMAAGVTLYGALAYLGVFETSFSGDAFLTPSGFGAQALAFCLCYIFTSLWFSPDLDHREHRPGKHTFPFGHVFKLIAKIRKSGFVPRPLLALLDLTLSAVHAPVNLIWYWLWYPLSRLVTHRGATHWPIYGSLLRIAYLFTAYWFFSVISRPLFELPYSQTALFTAMAEVALLSLDSPVAIACFLGVVVADLMHIAVDYYDSSGKSFVPPAAIAPRGLVVSALKHAIKALGK